MLKQASEAESTLILQRTISGEPADRVDFAADAHRRLFDAITTPRAAMADLASLTRQVLRREAIARGGGAQPFFDVPDARPWPTAEEWAEFSCEATPVDSERHRVRASRWRPTWLPEGREDLDVAVAAGLLSATRRQAATVPADPFFTDSLGQAYTRYTTTGQRQAVRAAAWLQPGATLLVNLPTGSGKTEVALGPALLSGSGRGVSILFVPTISLAQDMERRLGLLQRSRSGQPKRFAYTSQTDAQDREEIRTAISAGTIPIVVTSPESGLASLKPALKRAAENGLLRFFIVDEAHLVREWGTDFRPALAGLASLRRELLDAAPTQETRLRTLLLSATFSEADIRELPKQFSPDGRWDVVAANALRSEPTYWFEASQDEEVRERKVLEAVRHLPKPLFLYASWVDDAERWVRLLRAAGHDRVAQVTGAVPGAERADVLRRLRGDGADATSVDVVVATSAFGLGISYDAVRSVIHACLPESIDRLYQEVGRAGRDGEAAIALTLFTEDDKRKAGPLSRSVVLGAELARNRWQAMSRGGERDDAGRLLVDLTAVPKHVDRASDINQAWNATTLALMRRAEFIAYASADSAQVGDDDEITVWASRAAVEVLEGGLAREDVWEQAWARLKIEIHSDEQARRLLVETATLPSTRLCDLLIGAYDVPAAAFDGRRVGGLRPTKSCGQCRACVHDPRVVIEPEEPPPPAVAVMTATQSRAELFRDNRTSVVLVAPPASDREEAEVIGAFVDNAIKLGARQIVVGERWRSHKVVMTAHKRHGAAIVVGDYETDVPWSLLPIPTAVVGPLDGTPASPAWLAGTGLPGTILLLGTTAPSPLRADRTINDIRPPGTLGADDLRDLLP